MLLRRQMHVPTLEAVHRLDRDTTGCLLLAKTHTAYNAAVEVFKTHSVKKVYYAIVAGRFPHAHETVNAPLDGKPAVSHFTRETVSSDASFLKVRIETGRTNQIRRHLASTRFPILGDRTFGLKTARDPRLMSVNRQMLHAAEIELPDPMRNQKEPLKAHSPLPADFRQCLRTFGI
jgi:23S rRNA-/tRNA-specific pseudouridylate synthase